MTKLCISCSKREIVSSLHMVSFLRHGVYWVRCCQINFPSTWLAHFLLLVQWSWLSMWNVFHLYAKYDKMAAFISSAVNCDWSKKVIWCQTRFPTHPLSLSPSMGILNYCPQFPMLKPLYAYSFDVPSLLSACFLCILIMVHINFGSCLMFCHHGHLKCYSYAEPACAYVKHLTQHCL